MVLSIFDASTREAFNKRIATPKPPLPLCIPEFGRAKLVYSNNPKRMDVTSLNYLFRNQEHSVLI